MPPYKKQIVAGDVPQLKPFDYSKQLDAIAADMNRLSEKTADMARANFLNNFELESRKALAESFDRNMNDPAQLEAEQQKIQQKFVSALPTQEMRDEAKLRFTVHAMGYLGKAKQNRYTQELKALQASTLDKANVLTNDIRGFGTNLYDANLGVSGTAALSIGNDIVSLQRMSAEKDANGEFVLSPEKQAALKDNIRTQLTLADMDFFNTLETPQEMEKFYKAYKNKETKKIWMDPEDERGYSEQAMNENNTDWPTYKKNLAMMERAINSAKTESVKNMSTEDKGAFGKAKVAVMERLDTAKSVLKNDEKTDPFKVLAFLQEVNDYGKPSNGYKGQNGEYAPFLEPMEMYQYRKEVREKYMPDVLEAINKGPYKTNFAYGMAGINKFFEDNAVSHGMNDYDKMDIMAEYYRQVTHAGIPAGALQDRASGGYNEQVLGAAQRAITAWVSGSKKFNEREKNMLTTTPPEIKQMVVPAQDMPDTRRLPIFKY